MTTRFPPPDEWPRLEPEDAGISAPLLQEAVEFAKANESDWPHSLFLADGRYVGNAYVEDQPPHDKPLGVVRPRGGANGLILRHGQLVAEWGDTVRPDTTFSAAKSYLGLLAGIALDEGLIDSVDDPVARYMPPEDTGFSSDQNRPITWRHLLQQTSEWRGTLGESRTASIITGASDPATTRACRLRYATLNHPGRAGNTTTCA